MFKFYTNRPLIERPKEAIQKNDYVTSIKKGRIYKPAKILRVYKKSRKYYAVIFWDNYKLHTEHHRLKDLIKTRKDTFIEFFIKRPIYNRFIKK